MPQISKDVWFKNSKSEMEMQVTFIRQKKAMQRSASRAQNQERKKRRVAARQRKLRASKKAAASDNSTRQAKKQTPSPVRVLSSAAVSKSAAAISVAVNLFKEAENENEQPPDLPSHGEGGGEKVNSSAPSLTLPVGQAPTQKQWKKAAKKDEYWSSRFGTWMVRDNSRPLAAQQTPWVDDFAEQSATDEENSEQNGAASVPSGFKNVPGRDNPKKKFRQRKSKHPNKVGSNDTENDENSNNRPAKHPKQRAPNESSSRSNRAGSARVSSQKRM